MEDYPPSFYRPVAEAKQMFVAGKSPGQTFTATAEAGMIYV